MLNTALSAAGGLLGAFLGGRRGTGVTSTVRGAGRVARTRKDVAHAGETVEAVQGQLADLEREFQEELAKVADGANGEEVLEEEVVRPALNAISLRLVTLVWLPWGTDAAGRDVPLWRPPS
jgi:hypothetical protein